MPRKTHIDAPGALHHIIVGIERRKIFKDDTDRVNFLDWLGKAFSETGRNSSAWKATDKSQGFGISRLPRKMLPYVLKVSDRAGSECISRLRYIRFCLPYHPATSAPWNIWISRLNTRPIRTTVNASAMSLLPHPHDYGAVWLVSSFTV